MIIDNPFGLSKALWRKRALLVAVLLALLPLAFERQAFAQEVVTQLASKECQPAANCVVVFPAVPAGKNLTIMYASCQATVSPLAVKFSLLSLGSGVGNNFTSPKHFLSPLSLVGSNTTRNFFAVSTPMLVLMAEGAKPMIKASLVMTPTIFVLTCTISGTQTLRVT